MSHEARAWVWECSQAKGVGRFILLAVAEKAPASTCQAYASLSWLQDMANAGRPAVVQALKDLFASGALEVVEGETGPFGASVYRLPKAIGYVPGSAKSVRSQNRSKAAVSSPDALHLQSNSSLTEPIEGADMADCGARADSIGCLTGPGGSLSEPIQGGCLTEPIAEIGSLTEPAEKESGGQSVLFGSQIGSVKQPLHKPTTNTSTKETRASSGPKRAGRKAANDREEPLMPAAFAAFWAAYPKKASKPDAVKAWNAALGRDADPAKLAEAAVAYAKWPGRDPGYTKNPATWLNKDCWEDDLPEVAPRTGSQRHQAYSETGGYEFGSDWFDEDPR